MTDPDTTTTGFEGHQPRRCNEHRTVGPHRAWCFVDEEWCYPDQPCEGCGPTHEQIAAEARASERQRIRQMAHDAVGDCPNDKCCLPLFAELLEDSDVV